LNNGRTPTLIKLPIQSGASDRTELQRHSLPLTYTTLQITGRLYIQECGDPVTHTIDILFTELTI